ncbi:hypothetical protein A3L14_06525 [Thermococcus thioreducens]|uniref:Uncharacterized protein n=2 Tax=Thermococcus thioreducens TaxID=277988 RepID=A0A0Q2UP10_9EURY|nr:hypothetical protein A3L14_06525 [Thermococcus thioreducens]KQH82440.1 hypothetical protein AMR53_05715 [Thermococcus thioreducens]SEV88676.1 hypothetical protein SAMN05216170_0646 [Thermococcus thioreducens]
MNSKNLKFLVILLIVLIGAYPVNAMPYWAKPGVYIKYASLRHEEIARKYASTGMSLSTGDVVLEVNGTYIQMSAMGDTYLTFTILGDEGDYLLMKLILEMFNVTIKQFGDKTVVLWPESALISKKTLDNETLFNVTEARYSCTYKIRKEDSMVFDTAGTNYGHTILWDDLGNAPITVDQPFQLVGFAGNSISKVVNVTSLDVSVITRTSNFTKPVIYVRTAGGMSVKTPIGEVSFSRTDAILYFDGSTGMFVTGLFPTAPDLAACGVKLVYFMDQWGMYMSKNHKEDGKLYTYGIGFYDTNAEFGVAETVQFSKSETDAAYLYTAVVLLLVLAVVVAWRKRQ